MPIGRSMFLNAVSFRGDVSGWNTASLRSMQSTFSGASNFTSAIGGWDVSRVGSMLSLFRDARSFSADLNLWDVSSVTDTRRMFQDAVSFNGEIGAWDVSRSTKMDRMFNGAASFNVSLTAWDVSSVTTIEYLFQDATSFNGDLGSWDVGRVASMKVRTTSHRCQPPSSYRQPPLLDAGRIPLRAQLQRGPEPLGRVFSHANARVRLPAPSPSLLSPPLSQRESIPVARQHVQARGEFQLQFERLERVSSARCAAPQLELGHVSRYRPLRSCCSSWATPHVAGRYVPADTRLMFDGATAFAGGGIGNWDVGSVFDMAYMFRNAISFSAHIGQWNVAKVRAMHEMFHGTLVFNGDLSRWDVGTVTDMRNTFSFAQHSFGDLSSWNVSAVTLMEGMLDGLELSFSPASNLRCISRSLLKPPRGRMSPGVPCVRAAPRRRRCRRRHRRRHSRRLHLPPLLCGRWW